ncbi:hypothetical protein BASA60_004498 [Batrachochytrium salamandrivorans]|nr:hypothetical protein BASA60_004498 [Batrachochytrium salamandrivorans]KAH9256580.1 hypothetical protein BASA81_005272 [Batrachochytrium salamandrivorans]
MPVATTTAVQKGLGLLSRSTSSKPVNTSNNSDHHQTDSNPKINSKNNNNTTAGGSLPRDANALLKGRYASIDAAAAWTPPPFTLKDVRNVIPAHCFKRNTMRSLGYVLHDAVLLTVLFIAASYFSLLPMYLQIVAWPLYWIAQGSVGFGVWILAHECGHGAFSPSTTINNIFGWVMHSFVLVPYFSWKFSHSKHHKSSGHMLKDEAFVPPVRSSMGYSHADSVVTKKDDQADIHHESLLADAPITQLLRMFSMLLFGFPMYLLIHSSGQAYPEWVTHFTPNSVIFTEKNRPFVLLSDLGIFLVLGIIGLCAHRYGALNVFMYYGVPYLVVNFWLVAITFLQHTDPIIAHYRGEEWSFLRGALSTIDRDYGIFNHFHHHIGDTHVVHHLFSTLPHYHAEEATEAIKEFLGKYYSYDSRPILEALYSNFIVCKFVEDEGDVVFYKH